MEPLPRTNTFVVMLSDHELGFIRNAAQARGVEPVDLIRQATFDAVFADRCPRLPEPETLELTAASRGRWLAYSKNSTHYWDLDSMRYASWRGDSVLAEAVASESRAIPIASVDRYPKVGGKSLVFYTDPSDGTEYWRESSVIERIERLGAPKRQEIEAHALDGQVIVNGSAELFAINGSNMLAPGEACAAAFHMHERGEADIAKLLWAAAAAADRQAEETA